MLTERAMDHAGNYDQSIIVIYQRLEVTYHTLSPLFRGSVELIHRLPRVQALKERAITRGFTLATRIRGFKNSPMNVLATARVPISRWITASRVDRNWTERIFAVAAGPQLRYENRAISRSAGRR